MGYRLALCVLLCGMIAQPAVARSLVVDRDGLPITRLQTMIDEAAVPTPEETITVDWDTTFCGASVACTAPGRPVYMDVRWASAPTFLHEVGHHFDYAVMTDRARAEFSMLVHDKRPWRAGPNALAEKFAVAYSLCARHRTIRVPGSRGYRYWTDPARHRSACLLIRLTANGYFG